MHNLPYPVTDIHVHIQPWQQLHPSAQAVMSFGRPDYESLAAMMNDPAAVLARMDEDGIDRIGMINYVAPRLMGFLCTSSPFNQTLMESSLPTEH